MKIILTDYRGNLFASVNNFNEANTAARSIFKRKYWSDLRYEIHTEEGDSVTGSIDLEPYSFHARHQREILTKHLKTYWGNVASTTVERHPYLTQEHIDFAKNFINRFADEL